MEERLVSQKQDEADNVPLALHQANKKSHKEELIRRLGHIQRLARQKNYAEIEMLLQESYV